MYPTSGLGKTVAGLAMFTGLLVIAFPITILSINMSDLYNEYKVEKLEKEAQKNTGFAPSPIDRLRAKVAVTDSPLQEKQIEIFKTILQDLYNSDQQVEQINKVICGIVEIQEDIRAGIQGLLVRNETKHSAYVKPLVVNTSEIKEEALL